MTDTLGSDQPISDEADRALHAAIGRLTAGLSPTALGIAWYDWAMHLAGAPSKQAELGTLVSQSASELTASAFECVMGKGERTSLSTDNRFNAPQWQAFPFNFLAECFQHTENWWNVATAGTHGVDPHNAQVVNFAARQWLDMVSPSNFFATNPVVLERTRAESGANLERGMRNWLDDLQHLLSGHAERSEDFVVGETVATTQGEVIYRNRLIELIRYRPVTETVHSEPVLIVPAWIMKYYILDLSPANSLVQFLLERGFEVYMISWKNPDKDDADLGMDDYVNLGVRAAIDEVTRRVPDQKIHAAGYCLGGTLLAIAASTFARDGFDRLASLTFLAAQVDFTEAGEITLFINESQVSFLEDIMAEQGYLAADQMSGAFQMLRSNDLIWSRVIRHYLLGERTQMNDLMAWNADSTRMPARMHSEYLRRLFLDNALAVGQYEAGGRLISLEDIVLDTFVVGTEADHVSPWKSVWKLSRLIDGNVTFLLTNGGHNAGILSEPGHRHRHYRISEVKDTHQAAIDWQGATPEIEGSWWPVWSDWMAARSSGQRVPEKTTDAICAAPGSYVHLT